MKPLSIVVITYNRPEEALLLAENISRLQGVEELLEEVILVNNNSASSYQGLESFIAARPEVPFRYFALSENLGVSRGRNYAIRQSKAPILVFLDDDALFYTPDALPAIVTLFREEEAAGRKAGLAAFKVYYYDTMEWQQNAFPSKRFQERKDWPHFDAAYFSGCAHAIRRSVFEEVGYYPENFFYGMEEYDLSYRALDAGWSIRYDHRVVVLHKESPGGRLTRREKLRGMWVNKSKVAWKYLPKIDFYTTVLLWSLFYLVRSKGDMGGFGKGWKEIIRIPTTEKRSPLKATALSYLKKVKARLSY